MDGPPPPLPSDPEEVAWALGTAESLWKRGERVDAVVWVRRAAAAAEECDDEARAATLRQQAADLGAWIGSNTVPPPGESERPPKGSTDDLDALLSEPPSRQGSEVFTLSTKDVELISTDGRPSPEPRRDPRVDARSVFPDVEIIEEHMTDFPSSFPDEEPTPLRRSAIPEATAPTAARAHAGMLDPWSESGRPRKRTPITIPRDDDEPPTLTFEEEEVVTSAKRKAVQAPPAAGAPSQPIPRAPDAPQFSARKGRPPMPEEEETTTYRQVNPRTSGGDAPRSVDPPPASRLPSMGPLARPRSVAPPKPSARPGRIVAEPEAPTRPVAPAPVPVAPPAADSLPPALDLLEMIDATTNDDESPAPRRSAPPLPAQASKPLPVSIRPTSPPPSTMPLSAATPSVAVVSRVSSRPTALPPPATSSIPAAALPSSAPTTGALGAPTAAPPATPSLPPSGYATTPGLDLTSVEALTDLPDDARDAFGAAAKMHTIANDEEVSNFALALVVDGEIDVSATIVDAPALRLARGSVLRSRGSIVPGVALRLVCASSAALVATWDDAAVEAAFRSCPWVEEDLRALADRVQAQAGVTMGALGERFDQSLRAHLTSKLTVRKLEPGEVLIEQGKPTPIAVVGIGEIVVSQGGERGTILRSGDFVFPSQILAHAPAPASAVAGAGGAVVLFGDRAVAQELLMSFPPLLEVLATI